MGTAAMGDQPAEEVSIMSTETDKDHSQVSYICLPDLIGWYEEGELVTFPLVTCWDDRGLVVVASFLSVLYK